MQEYYICFDKTSGNILWRGQGPEGATAAQPAHDVMTYMQVPQAALLGTDVDMDVVKTYCGRQVDAGAEAVRSQFLSAGTGQAMTYLAKQTEAAAYLANNAVSTPFLTAEAAATGMTVDALAVVVAAQTAAWQTLGAKIEAARRGAKVAIAAAENIAEIHDAHLIDWQAVLA